MHSVRMFDGWYTVQQDVKVIAIVFALVEECCIIRAV